MFEYESILAADRTVVALRGELDTFAAQKLDAFLADLVSRAESPITVDLAELQYMNSSGLRSFLRLDKLIQSRGLSFVIRGTQRHVARTFIYGSLDAYFKFEEPDISAHTKVARI